MTARTLALEETSSTQTVARKMADEGCPAWTVVTAKRQTRGRGRMKRRWDSGPGGAYFSIVLRPPWPPSRLPALSLRCGDILARTLARETGLKTMVKPPNDVLAASTGPFKKVCGILIEATGTSERTEWIVIGVGINVNNKIPKTLPHAASLAALAGRPFDPDRIRKAAVGELRKGLK